MNKLVIQAIVNIVAIIGALIALINQDFWLIGNLLISLSLFMNSYNYYKLNKKISSIFILQQDSYLS